MTTPTITTLEEQQDLMNAKLKAAIDAFIVDNPTFRFDHGNVYVRNNVGNTAKEVHVHTSVSTTINGASFSRTMPSNETTGTLI